MYRTTNIYGVIDVHHIYPWSLDEENINFESHLNVEDMLVSDTEKIKK